ncbi:ferric enterobactin esterase [Dictyobacter alpinus]|uniref:Ferric enterobactin esterase n=1 Tax=Dictyobacter alpinus TaxID=2014873 RepID=A0A402BEE8_9CHLR|nr:alpha/beta hydrolase-fold protein [Dictyobacter alpinus]GCE29699.1 ferric enterobactin esterase [Dictyobacter alpinus]
METMVKRRTPFIDGGHATFIWRGEHAPELIGDFTNWETQSRSIVLQQMEPGVWGTTLSLPRDAYIEYCFVLNGQQVADPLNPRVLKSGISSQNNYFWMPDGSDTSLMQTHEGRPRGRMSEHMVSGERLTSTPERQVCLYQPAVDELCPLVVVLDGHDYLYQAHLATMVDNLIAEQRIRPIALAFVSNGGSARTVEYACSDATLAFLLDRVLPLAQDQLHVLDIQASPGTYGILGASMGGLMGLYAGLRMPHIFGRVLCESGAFGGHQPAYRLYYRSVIEDLLALHPAPDLKLWMDVGRYEWFLEPNRQMYARLREQGYDVTYKEHNSGHNYPSWRNIVWEGLEHLFGRST